MSVDVEAASLPNGWTWATVDQLAETIQYGHTESAQLHPVGPKFLRITDIQDDSVNWETVPYCHCSQDDHRAYRLLAGDIVFARTGATTGKSYLISNCPDAVFASYLIRLRLLPSLITPRYFALFLRSPLYWQQIMGARKGSAQPGVNATILATLRVPIAPLSEQDRIADELDKLFSQLQASVAALKRVQANLKRYRAAVLRAACEGRLVPTEAELARAEGRDYETAEQLLARILAERRVRREAGQIEMARGRPPKDGAPGRGYQDPASPGTGGLQDLPEGWSVATLEQLTSAVRVICYGILMPKDNVPDGVLYVRVKDMKNDRIAVAGLHRTSHHIAAAYARASLKPGDLLLAIRGTYGRVAEVPAELDGGNITQDTARLDVNGDLDRRYIATYLRCRTAQDYFKRVARGVAVKGVNIADVRLMPVPLPPLAEQHRIVAEVERRLSILDETEAVVNANLKRAERLRQAILKRAFEGKLVPQDPSDEPAGVLLEHIRAEQEAGNGRALNSGARRRRRSEDEYQPELNLE